MCKDNHTRSYRYTHNQQDFRRKVCASSLQESEDKSSPQQGFNRKNNGFSFEYAKISFKASQLGKKYSWKNLEPFIVMSSLPDKNESCVLNDIRENFNEAKETGKK